MGATSIKITESNVLSAVSTTSGGEIAVILTDVNVVKGRCDKVYTINSSTELSKIYGAVDSSKDLRICKYLIKRGNTLKTIRSAKVTGGTKASHSFATDDVSKPLIIQAVEAGAAYNDTFIKLTNQGGEGDDNLFSVEVYDKENGTLLERFSIVSLNPNSIYYWGVTVKSNIIEAQTLPEGVTIDYTDTSVSGKLADGSGTIGYDLTVATKALSDRNIGFSLLIIPSEPDNSWTNIQTLINIRKDFLYITTIPDASSVDTAITTVGSSRSSYLAELYNYVYIPDLGGKVPATVAYADLVADLHRRKLWFKAPAGTEYGLLSDVVDLSHNLSSEDIKKLQEANIIPIVLRTGVGCVAWGNSVTANTVTEVIQRVSVRVLVNYLKRNVYNISQNYIFADHNEFTWNQWKNAVEPLVRDIYSINGIQDYRIVCDRTIMTEEDIANGIMRGRIVIQPNFQIETIDINFAIDETGISFD